MHLYKLQRIAWANDGKPLFVIYTQHTLYAPFFFIITFPFTHLKIMIDKKCIFLEWKSICEGMEGEFMR